MTGDQPKQPVTISREDLYARVWATPMMQLAARYGISGNGLSKICRKLAVPYPGRGYWARKAAGQKVGQVRLPDKAEGVPSQVRIAPSLPPPPPPRLAADLEGKLAAARLLTSGITVPAKLPRPHPVIAAWIEDRRRRRQEARTDPWRRMSDVPDFSAIERRRHRFLDALFKVLERHAFKAKIGERGEIHLEVERERLNFELKEKYRQARRPLTDEERRAGYNIDRPWKQETQPTGMLLFSIKTHLDSALDHVWVDRPKDPIEAQLSEIAATLMLAGPILKERRRQHEEAERRRLEEERRRYQEQQRLQQDRNRWRHFVGLAHLWQEAETARHFLAELENRLQGNDATFGNRSASRWVEWARERLAEYDPLAGDAQKILQDVAKVDAWTYRD